MKKVLVLLGIALIVVVLTIGTFSFTTSAASTEGYYTYTISNSKAKITDVDTTISGNVTIPSTLGGYPVTSIGSEAFRSCNGLTSIEIPNGVTSIGDYAFYDCNNLISINIPNSVTSIGLAAFYNCTNLTKVNITDIEAWCKITFGNAYANPLSEANNLYLNNELVTELVIPNSVTSIGKSAFYGCSSLTSIEIPNSVTNIGNGAFYGCSLTSITLPFIGASRTATNGYNQVFGYIFGYSKTSSSSPVSGAINQYNSNGNYYHYYIPSSLKNVIITDTTNISVNAFYNCSSLTNIEIPNSVTSIGDYAFFYCDGLTNIEIPNGVTSIGDYAFYRCDSLISVNIPNSVTSIGLAAFHNCTSLTTVYYAGTEEQWNEIEIGSSNQPLLNAELVFVPQKSELELALEGTGLSVGKLADETEVVIVPTPSGKVAMTGTALATKLNNDSISVVSNNGIIGTGSKIIMNEQEIEIAVKGDIDGDGIVSVFDALMVKKALAENSFSENDIREFAGDIDGEGVTNTEDVDAILAHIVGEMLIAQ